MLTYIEITETGKIDFFWKDKLDFVFLMAILSEGRLKDGKSDGRKFFTSLFGDFSLKPDPVFPGGDFLNCNYFISGEIPWNKNCSFILLNSASQKRKIP